MVKRDSRVQIKCNPIYRHIAKTDAEIIICYGGRDSGKSYYVGGQLIPSMMMKDEYFRGVCVRKTYTSLKDSCYQEVIDGLFAARQMDKFNATINPLRIEHMHSGNKLLFRGLDTPRKLKSLKGISFIWVEEAEDLTEREFFDLLMLLRGGDKPKIVLTFNPIDEEHFTNGMFVESLADEVLETFADGEKKVWIKNLVSTVGTEEVKIKSLVLRTTYEDNNYISTMRKATIEQLKESDPFLYDVYKKGKFGTKGGRILYNVEQRDFAKEGLEFVNFDNKGYAQDFGFNHANAILSVAEKDDCLYVFDELYGYEKDTGEWIEEAEGCGLDKNLPMVCDSAEPDRIKTWQSAGYRARGVKKHAGSVKAQIDRLKRYEKIYINTTCVNTYKEAKSWKFKENKHGKFTDEPVNIYDDAMAALRYATDMFDGGSARMIRVRRG